MNGWMVTEGDYSAYRVLAVFTDHDAACAYAAKRRVMPGPYDYEGDPVRIERVEIDPAGIADGDYSAAVVVTMDVDTGDIREMRVYRAARRLGGRLQIDSPSSYDGMDGRWAGETWHQWGSPRGLHTIIAYSPNADYAKIAGERRAQWLARQEGWRDE